MFKSKKEKEQAKCRCQDETPKVTEVTSERDVWRHVQFDMGDYRVSASGPEHSLEITVVKNGHYNIYGSALADVPKAVLLELAKRLADDSCGGIK